jgi:hypothetical protein
VFTRVSDGAIREFDTGLWGIDYMQMYTTGAPFVHSVHPDLDVYYDPAAVWVPGINELTPGDPSSQVEWLFFAQTQTGAVTHGVIPPPPPEETAVPPDPERGYWGYANGPACQFGVKFCHDLFGGGSGAPCVTDAGCPGDEYCWEDCWGDWRAASCVVHDNATGAARCYIPKNRYLTIDPTVNPAPTAYHVTLAALNDNNCTYPCLPDGHVVEGFLSDPVCREAELGCTLDPAPNAACQGTYVKDPGPPPILGPLFGWVSYVVPGPVTPRVWNEYPLFITGCETVPAATYEIRGSPNGITPLDPPLILPTSHLPPGGTQFWGDITSDPGIINPWMPPEYAMNMADVSAVIRTFEDGPDPPNTPGGPPFEWCDVEIDHVVSFSDVQFLLFAFAGQQYCDVTDIMGGCQWEQPRPLIGHEPCDCPPYVPPP